MKAEHQIAKTPSLVRAEDRVPRWVMPVIKTAILLADARLATVNRRFTA